MKTVYAGTVALKLKEQVFWDLNPSVLATDEQLIVINNHKRFAATSKVSVLLGFPAGAAVAYATVWWCPNPVRAYSACMIQSSEMVGDKPVTLTLDIPVTDDTCHGADDSHGVLCLGFRGVSTEQKTPVQVSVAVQAGLVTCVGRLPYPGSSQLTDTKFLGVALDTLVRWT